LILIRRPPSQKIDPPKHLFYPTVTFLTHPGLGVT
jgi:hypothetical protein